MHRGHDAASRAGREGPDPSLARPLEVVAGEGHFEHLDPSSEVWRRTRAYLDARLRP